jgi:transposase
MPKRSSIDFKLVTLQEHASLNPRPQAVTDPLFLYSDFFDPRDLVQVKYEMLRRVRVEGRSVRQACLDFGFSRPSFYQAKSAFMQEGLPGLAPRKRGPRQAHKLTGEVLAFLLKAKAEQPHLGVLALAQLLEQKFGVQLHRRTIERGLARQRKKGR